MIKKCGMAGALLLVTWLSGCGLAETATTAAAQGAAAAEQVREGKALEASVQQRLDAAQADNKQALEQAEAGAPTTY